MVSRETRRAPLLAIDRLMDMVELGHLEGRTTVTDAIREQMRLLSALVVLPTAVTTAVDTMRLHAALLHLEAHMLRFLNGQRITEAVRVMDSGMLDDPRSAAPASGCSLTLQHRWLSAGR